MPTPAVAVTIASTITEPNNRSRFIMCRSSRTPSAQWVFVQQKAALFAIVGGAIRAFALGKQRLFHPPSVQDSWQPEISLDAARLGIDAVFLVALFGEFLFHCPRMRPHRRVFDRHLIRQAPRTRACPAFNQMQILPRALKVRLRTEIGHVDDKRIAFPVSP